MPNKLNAERRIVWTKDCVFSSATQLEQLLNVDFPPLIKRLNQSIGSPTPQPSDIQARWVAMDPINKWFYDKSLKELCEVGAAATIRSAVGLG